MLMEFQFSNSAMAVSRCFFSVFLLQLCCYTAQHINMESTQISPSIGARHSKDYCAMYDICGERKDGKVLNCPNGSSSIKPGHLFYSRIQSLCPTVRGNVCCTEAQFDVLRSQVQQAIPLLVGCPACLRNFLNLFCELTCSPDQSLFINVTSVSEVSGNLIVNGIDYFVSDSFGEMLYDSCKDVKFGSMNTRALDFVGAGAKNFKDWFAFIGQKAGSGLPGSPYSIGFKANPTKSSGMECMNVSTYSCSDTSLGCSCGDCPSSPTCSNTKLPSPHKNDFCIIKLGNLKARCIEVSLAILYSFFASAFIGWGFVHRKREGRGCTSSMKPLLGFIGANENLVVQNKRDASTVVNLWVAPGSKAAEEKIFFERHLAPFYRIEQIILATTRKTKHGNLPSIVTEENIQFLFEIQEKVDAIQSNFSGLMVSLNDICLKPLGNDCATQSILQYYKMDPDNYDDYGGVEHAEYCFEHFTSSDKCMSAFKGPLDPSTVLGGFSGNNYSEASALIITYPVKNAIDVSGNEIGKAVSWEKSFIQLLKDQITPMAHSRNLTISFSSEISIQEELKRESYADVVTILISYVVMFLYISVTLGDVHNLSTFYLSSKVVLGLSGVIIVLLSVLGSVGFFSAFGVKSTLIIMEVIPFLVLAVGVDNMCILVHAMKRQPSDLNIETRISNALEEVGPSITMASLSEFMAFAVAAFIPMPACHVFSMFAALAVFLDFVLQVTAFVSLIVLDFQRTEDGRIDCFPCIKVGVSPPETDEGIVSQKHGFLRQYMVDIHAPILSCWAVKMGVIAVFSAFTFSSIALSTRIYPGLEQKIVLPRDSYLQGYFNNVSEYLRIGPPLYFVVKSYNYSEESSQTNKLCSISQCYSNSLLNEVSRASQVPENSYIAKPAASWLDDFLVWMSPEAFGCCRKFLNGTYCPPDDQPPCCSPSEGSCGLGELCRDCTTCFQHSELHNDRPSMVQFREKLPWFLNALPSADCAKGGHGAYTNSLDLTGYEEGIIKASEFRTYHTPLNKQSDFVNSLRAAREFSSRLSKSLNMDIFPYSVFYIFFEQYLDIWKTALISLSVALSATFIVCFINTWSLWGSAIILLVLMMIVVDLLGVMAIFHIQLNAVSVVNLIMSVGIGVEFCVHITHSFMVSHGNREQRAAEALVTMGASVLSGITLTKLVGVVVLFFSRSEFFVVYFFKMYLALVLIGFLHGLVFLPVVLSIFGPPSRSTVVGEEMENESSSSPATGPSLQ